MQNQALRRRLVELHEKYPRYGIGQLVPPSEAGIWLFPQAGPPANEAGRHFPVPDIQQRVVESFEIIAQNPYQNALDIVKLKGEENKYRLRLGKYRFLYEIIEEQILVYAYKANSRGDVYK